MYKPILFGAIVAFTAFFSTEAEAWGKYGHVTICEVTYRGLTDTARDELNRLMLSHTKNTSFNRACLFADDFPRKHPSNHFGNYDRSTRSITTDECDNNTKCIFEGIKRDYGILSDTTANDADRATAMVLLGHWVGDIHQPLHISFKDDRGGNSTKKRGTCSGNNLHSVWDNCILTRGVYKLNAIERQLGWRKFTKAYRYADNIIAGLSPSDVSAWLNSDLEDWANESLQITLSPSVKYCVQKGNECWYTDTQKTYVKDESKPHDGKKVIQMNMTYINAHSSIVEERLSQASVRLIDLINTALDPAYVRP